uniref:Purple acid phosphatase n=1 Tax=Glossina brevipalpis TaxID=37001 RepID=A0A1A9WVN1_9MUSC
MSFLMIACILQIIVNNELVLGAKAHEDILENLKTLYYQPEQVHISFGEKPHDIVVTWSTGDDPGDSVVQYRQNEQQYTRIARGTRQKFTDGGSEHKYQYIHRVTLSNLKPSTKYVYNCGSLMGWSARFDFRTVPEGDEWSPQVAIFGDMGNENAQSLARLQQESQRGMYEAIIHVGDFAYDMNSDSGRVGDEFMRQIETIAAYVPNFSNYRNRFSMPNDWENLFYSYNLGPIHFISISTEVYYFLNYGMKPLVFQYNWLENDLKEATKKENRIKQPWIIVYGHRPMYCSNADNDDCTHSETLTRVGWPFFHAFGLEDLFYSYGVDVEIWAHEHTYERLWPIYNYTVMNGSQAEPYRNPMAPVHIITGSAGCKEGHDNFIHNISNWSAFHSQDYGYTRLRAYNSTHLHFEQVSDDQRGAIVDEFWLIKDKHESFVRPSDPSNINDSEFCSCNSLKDIDKYNVNNPIGVEKLNDIVITWSTRDATNQSVVFYRENNNSYKWLTAQGSAMQFIDGGPTKSKQFIHKVVLKNLKWKTRYEYVCGSEFGWSAEFFLETVPEGDEWSPRLAIYGDMGNSNAQSMARLQQDAEQDMYDAIIHIGDFAYDLDTDNGEVGDAFMQQIQSIAAYVPYMARFNMPGKYDNLWYSFNLGPVHFISFSTEVYYYLNFGLRLLTKQFEFLENDLKQANRPENRAKQPWIITYGHRPMYCSDDKEYDCNSRMETFIRQGLPPFKLFGLEQLFYKYGVDVEFFAHEHFYTRLWPIYDFKVYNNSAADPYMNSTAPIQIITGSAGNKENREPFSKELPEWNAFHSNDYGYTRLKAYNRTHLYLEQVSDDKNGAIIDKFWIIKYRHGPYII